MHGQPNIKINIQSTLCTPTYLYKNVSLHFCLVATVIYVQCIRSQICVYVCIHIFFTI